MEEKLKIQAYYRQHPDFFFKYFLGVDVWDKQLEIAESVRDNRVTTVRSCHSAGKSYIAACIALWYLSAYPGSIVVTTAPTWRQVKDILWRNINTRYANAKIPLGGNSPNVTGWQISTNWFAIGVSSKDPDKIQGYHAESGHLLAICDEAAGIEEPIFQGIDAILTGSKCRKLEIGNPTSSSGTFRDNHKPGAKTTKIRISAFDTPNFTANGIRNEDELEAAMRQVSRGERKLVEVADYLISPEWVHERLHKWGRNNPWYRARILGEFPDIGENNLIPLSWLEAACTPERLEKVLGLKLRHPQMIGADGKPAMSEAKFERLEAENGRIVKEALVSYIAAQNTVRGVDVARFGSDATVITPRWGRIFGVQKAYHKQSTMETAGCVWPLVRNVSTDITCIDVIGLGGGVVDRLHELQAEKEAQGMGQYAEILGVNVALPASDLPKELGEMEFANTRAELYWKLRDWLESGDVYFMPDEDGNPPDELMSELCAIEYKFMGGKIYIEEKKEMKKRLDGNSPDHADSVMLTLKRAEENSWGITESEPAEPEEDDADFEPPIQAEEDGVYSNTMGENEY